MWLRIFCRHCHARDQVVMEFNILWVLKFLFFFWKNVKLSMSEEANFYRVKFKHLLFYLLED